MSAVMERIKAEPALVSAVVQAVVVAVVAFGLPLTDVQQAAILALSAAVLALFVRQRVTPTTN